MEPLGLIASAGSLVLLVGKLAKDIEVLVKKYTALATTLEDLRNDCIVLEVGFQEVEDRLGRNNTLSKNARGGFETCLTMFKGALNALEAEISKTASSDAIIPGLKISAKKRIQFLWNENIVKQHKERTERIMVYVNFLLGAFFLPEQDATRQIQQVEKAATIRSSRTQDSNRAFRYPIVGFDPEVDRSRPGAFGGTCHAPHSSFAAGTTVMATQDYYNTADGHLEFSKGDLIKIVERNSSRWWVGEFQDRRGRFSIDCCDMTVVLREQQSATRLDLDGPLYTQNPTRQRNLDAKKLAFLITLSPQEAFQQIVESGDVDQLRNLLDSNAGIDINAANLEGWTSLHRAVLRGELAILTELVTRGVDLNPEATEQKMTPLHMVAGNKHKEDIEIVRYLIESGANVSPTGANGYLLHTQVRLNHWNMASTLIACGIPIEMKDSSGMTALCLAAMLGRTAVVKRLIDLGANLNACEQHERPPITMAASAGFGDVVKLLQASGADMTLRDKKGYSTLHCAVSEGRSEVCEILLSESGIMGLEVRDKQGATPLHHAAQHGRGILLRSLALKFASDPERERIWNLTTYDGQTALHYAASRGQVTAGVELIAVRLDMRASSFIGLTPLHYAARHNRVEFAKMLLQQGGKEIVNYKSRSPIGHFLDEIAPVATMSLVFSFMVPVFAAFSSLLVAISQGGWTILSASLLFGGSVSLFWYHTVTNYDLRRNPLQLWRVKTSEEMISLGKQIFTGSGPLNFFVYTFAHSHGFRTIAACHCCTVLPCLGALLLGTIELLAYRLHIWNWTTDTMPLHIAVKYEHAEVVQLLVENGAELEARSDKFKTARDLARSKPVISGILDRAGAKKSTKVRK